MFPLSGYSRPDKVSVMINSTTVSTSPEQVRCEANVYTVKNPVKKYVAETLQYTPSTP